RTTRPSGDPPWSCALTRALHIAEASVVFGVRQQVRYGPDIRRVLFQFLVRDVVSQRKVAVEERRDDVPRWAGSRGSVWILEMADSLAREALWYLLRLD